MRLFDRRFATSLAFLVLCASASPSSAQSDSARSALPPRPIPFIGAWVTGGLGSASFAGAKLPGEPFPPSLGEGWVAVGPVVLGRRRVTAGAGINTSERIEAAWLFGARTTLGPLLLVLGAGSATMSGRNSNGEQSGSTTPIESATGWTAEGELSCVLGHYFGIGVATFRTGGTRARNTGKFLVLQIGRLR